MKPVHGGRTRCRGQAYQFIVLLLPAALALLPPLAAAEGAHDDPLLTECLAANPCTGDKHPHPTLKSLPIKDDPNGAVAPAEQVTCSGTCKHRNQMCTERAGSGSVVQSRRTYYWKPVKVGRKDMVENFWYTCKCEQAPASRPG